MAKNLKTSSAEATFWILQFNRCHNVNSPLLENGSQSWSDLRWISSALHTIYRWWDSLFNKTIQAGGVWMDLKLLLVLLIWATKLIWQILTSLSVIVNERNNYGELDPRPSLCTTRTTWYKSPKLQDPGTNQIFIEIFLKYLQPAYISTISTGNSYRVTFR